MKTKFNKTFRAIAGLSLVLTFWATPVSAATTSIVGGTNGSSCNSGGYFTPSSVTITSGDDITFSVPSSDPYSGGMEILGFPQGNIYVARGGSTTTQPITTNVSYHGTWPNAPSCLKGSGTITVTTPPAPPPSSPPSSGSTSGSSSGGSTQSTQSTSTTVKSAPATTAPVSAPTQQPTTTAPSTDNSSTTQQQSTSTTSQPDNTKSNTMKPTTATKSPGLKNVATLGGGGFIIILVGLFFAWRTLGRRRKPMQVVQPIAVQPTPEELAENQAAPAVTSDQPNTSESPDSQSPADSQGDNR